MIMVWNERGTRLVSQKQYPEGEICPEPEADRDEMRKWLKTIPKKLLLSEVGRRNNESRRIHAGGRPKVLKPCPKCGASFGAREMAKHIPQCH